MSDLWPKIEPTKLKAPVTILREQASFLGNQTQNVVIAEVSKPMGTDLLVGMEKIKAQNFLNASKPKSFFYAFHLVASTLVNYRYELFTIANDIRLYPVTLYLDEDMLTEIAPDEKGRQLVAKSEEEFLEVLQKILGSQKTMRVIQSILAQSPSFQPA